MVLNQNVEIEERGERHKICVEVIRQLLRQELKRRMMPNLSDCEIVVPLADGQVERRID